MEYKFEPQQCKQIDGLLFRPFTINGEEVFMLNLSKMLSGNKEESDAELSLFSDVIFKKIGIQLSPEEINQSIKERKIYVKDNV